MIDNGKTRDEIAKQFGFNFSLIEEKCGYVAADGGFTQVHSKKILRRSDTGAPVSVVGRRFKVHQPGQILDFFLNYAEQFNLKLHSAGLFGNGARYWALAETDIVENLNGNDPARLYSLLATAADGSLATLATPTAVRIICENTFRLAISTAAETATRQSHRSAFSDEKAAEGLGFDLTAASSAFAIQASIIRQLNEIKVSETIANGFLRTLVRPELAPAGIFTAKDFEIAFTSGKDREVSGFEALRESYFNAPGAKPGTARGLWEGATHYIDHVRGTDDGRLNSAFFGQGAEIKDRAWANVQVLLNS